MVQITKLSGWWFDNKDCKNEDINYKIHGVQSSLGKSSEVFCYLQNVSFWNFDIVRF